MEFKNRQARKQAIDEMYDRGEQIEPLAEKDGQVWVSFDDASVINSINAFEGNQGTGLQTRNRDGSLASTGKRVHAVNPDYFFLNRCMKKAKKLYVVSGHTPSGYRCIREQKSGRTYLKLIPVYVICRDGEGNLYCEGKTVVDEKTFIESYTDTLSNHLMAEILPLITEYGAEQTALEEMPI